jgi:uncharacterized membrane protein
MENRNSYELKLDTFELENIRVSTSGLSRVIEKRMNDGYTEKAKTLLYGGMSGKLIGGCVGGIVGSVVPFVGTALGAGIGAVLGSIWTANDALDVDYTRKFDAIKQQADNALQQALSSAYHSATRQVNRLLSEMQMEVNSLLRNILTEANEDLVSQCKEINQRQKATLEEVRKDQKEVAEMTQELKAIQKSLIAFRETVKP